MIGGFSKGVENLVSSQPLTSIDLFAGGGGFTLGLHKAGIKTLAALDSDAHAMAVLSANLPDVSCLEYDIRDCSCVDLASAIGTDEVDFVVGGPPCQGFSHVRQRDGANSGHRLVSDPRRDLFQDFLRFVRFFKPKIFVMENVLGIKSAASGRYFRAVHSNARSCGYRVSGQVVRAAQHGLPQKRQRQLIIGVRKDLGGFFRPADIASTFPQRTVTLWEAIGDLPRLHAGQGIDPCARKRVQLQKQLERYGPRFLKGVLEVQKTDSITAHVARPHNDRDLRDFARLREGETAAQAIARGEELEFPYDRSSFHDRFTRQHRNRLCSTIVAHLSKDGLMFIHPTQPRSLTPREAARIQGFPDWYQFPVSRTHQFRIVGNAVPPPIAYDVGVSLIHFLDRLQVRRVSLPKSHIEAANVVERLIEDLTAGQDVSDVPKRDMVRAWRSILFLYPGLHPDHDNHGAHVVEQDSPIDHGLFARLRQYYELSGWPVNLVPILDEMRARYLAGQIAEDVFYCVAASRAGVRAMSA